jgi:hypothetical protein
VRNSPNINADTYERLRAYRKDGRVSARAFNVALRFGGGITWDEFLRAFQDGGVNVWTGMGPATLKEWQVALGLLPTRIAHHPFPDVPADFCPASASWAMEP